MLDPLDAREIPRERWQKSSGNHEADHCNEESADSPSEACPCAESREDRGESLSTSLCRRAERNEWNAEPSTVRK
jgi:hypothetical protein